MIRCSGFRDVDWILDNKCCGSKREDLNEGNMSKLASDHNLDVRRRNKCAYGKERKRRMSMY